MIFSVPDQVIVKYIYKVISQLLICSEILETTERTVTGLDKILFL